jgi:hypothetical protein
LWLEDPTTRIAVSDDTQTRLRYRCLTGPDDRAFCERVSAALDEGYVLHGGPSLTFDGERVIVAQAVVLAEVEQTAT